METSPHILIVEDDRDIAELVAKFLRKNGLGASIAGNAKAMDRRLAERLPDLLVLDLMLPGEDGLAVARRLRAGPGDLAELPIIMLTAVREESDRIVGLEMGADDYLGKPFSPRELLARIRAVLRRASGPGKGTVVQRIVYRFEGWSLSPLMRELRDPEDVKVSLTGAEFDLLQAFCEHPRRILSRERLLDLTRGRGGAPFDRSVDTLVSRIRRKIERDPKAPDLLKTVRLGGYLFTPEVSRS
ncbi:MAG: response regulator [Rhodospirillales bacterium]